MRAWVIEEHGGPEVFKKIELPIPEPGPGEVRVNVAATSVNPVDYKIRSGAAAALAPALPARLHGDVAGTVDAVGQGVDRFSVGDKVYGCVGGCGPAQGVLADVAIADARLLAHAPRSIALEDAAALPLVTITAWEGFDKAGLVGARSAAGPRRFVDPVDGARVLVHGGTGGVGHVAVQLAKAMGAHVSATGSSSEKAGSARALGADETINYRDEPVKQYLARLTDGEGFDIVFDTVGGDNIARSIEAVKPNGQVVCIAGRSQIDGGSLHMKGASLHLVFMLIPLLYGVGRERHGAILERVAQLVDAGDLKPLIDKKRFTFDQVGAAHAHAESGEQVGKVLVVHPGRV